MNRVTWAGVAALALAGQSLHGQTTPPLEPFVFDETKPIKRAEPVIRPAPAATPAPIKGPRLTPVVPKSTPMPQPPMADPTGDIRISPQGTMRPDQVQLTLADSFYLRKVYDQAAAEYEKFLELYPNSPERSSVLYRLAESYRITGAVNAAKNNYDRLLSDNPTGELTGPACYRMAELLYQEKNFAAALPLFRRATVRLRDPKLIHSAKFFTGRCLEGIGQKVEARSVYEDLLRTDTDNPFYDASRLSLAVLLKEGGQKAEAVKQAQTLAKQTQNEELKAQATVYIGLWELELDHPAQAEEALRRALQLSAVGRWKDSAQLGLMQVLYNGKKYQALIDSYSEIVNDLSAEVRPQLLTLVATAHRQLGKTKEAIVLLEQLIKDYPDTAASGQAAYERLVCLYSTGDPQVAAEIEAYLQANPEAPKRDQVLLMKAELLFKKPDFAGASAIYTQLAGSRNLSAELKAEVYSKLGWCLMQNKEYARAVKAYTSVLEGSPQSKGLASALTQRGLARLRLNELAAAVRDFDDVSTRFPKARERELALQQKALTQGQLNDNAGMAKTFKLLLKDYPETPVAAEANYWIGWMAFEAKDYKAAIEPLSQARKLDKEQYFERASLRILLSHFYLEDKEAICREIDVYTEGGAKRPVPFEVLRWLGQGYFETAMSAKAEARTEAFRKAAKYLELASVREEAKHADFLTLGRVQLGLANFEKAIPALEKYLAATKEPSPRAVGLLALGQAQVGLKGYDGAQKTVNEVLSLQPDGELNAKARVLSADIQMARGNLEEAAKGYESVAVVIDDENLTPQALEKAIEAYKGAGREADAKRLLNTLQSRYPEYLQRKRTKE